MIFIDILIIVFLVFLLFIGLLLGAIRICSLVGAILIGALVASKFYLSISNLFSVTNIWVLVFSFLLIFSFSAIMVFLVGHIISKIVRKLIFGKLDIIFGAAIMLVLGIYTIGSAADLLYITPLVLFKPLLENSKVMVYILKVDDKIGIPRYSIELPDWMSYKMKSVTRTTTNKF